MALHSERLQVALRPPHKPARVTADPRRAACRSCGGADSASQGARSRQLPSASSPSLGRGAWRGLACHPTTPGSFGDCTGRSGEAGRPVARWPVSSRPAPAGVCELRADSAPARRRRAGRCVLRSAQEPRADP